MTPALEKRLIEQVIEIENQLINHMAALMATKKILFDAGITTPAAFDELYQKARNDLLAAWALRQMPSDNLQ